MFWKIICKKLYDPVARSIVILFSTMAVSHLLFFLRHMKLSNVYFVSRFFVPSNVIKVYGYDMHIYIDMTLHVLHIFDFRL